MLTEETVIDKIEVLEDGVIQVRQATRVRRDGVIISTNYHRWVIAPGDSLEGQDVRVQTIAEHIHTQDVIDAYKTDPARGMGQE